jgi:hypothetical protein
MLLLADTGTEAAEKGAALQIQTGSRVGFDL